MDRDVAQSIVSALTTIKSLVHEISVYSEPEAPTANNRSVPVEESRLTLHQEEEPEELREPKPNKK